MLYSEQTLAPPTAASARSSWPLSRRPWLPPISSSTTAAAACWPGARSCPPWSRAP